MIKRVTGLLVALTLVAAAGSPLAAQRSDDGWLGITFHHTDNNGAGVIIDDVFPDSPADEAGLREGDIILEWNGRDDVMDVMLDGDLEVGETVRLRVRRGGSEQNLRVTAGNRPDVFEFVIPRAMGGIDPEEMVRFRIHADSLAVQMDSLQTHLRVMLRDSLAPHLREMERELRSSEVVMRARAQALEAARRGLMSVEFGGRGIAGAELTEMNDGLSSYFGTDDGVLVLRVSSDTPADRAGLKAGDVIVGAAGDEVDDVSDLRANIVRADDEQIPLTIVRDGQRLDLRLRWSRPRAPRAPGGPGVPMLPGAFMAPSAPPAPMVPGAPGAPAPIHATPTFSR